MPKKKFKLSPREIGEIEGALLSGELGPEEPDNINISHEADRCIKEFGDMAVKEAEIRAEISFHEEDRNDWAEVVRVIKARQTKMARK